MALNSFVVKKPLHIWQALLKKWPDALSSKPRPKGSNSIWFVLNKNLSTASSRYFRNCLRTKRRSLRPRRLLRNPKENGRKGKARFLHILRRRSIPTLSYPNLHPKRQATQKIWALFPNRISKLEQRLEALASRKGVQEVGMVGYTCWVRSCPVPS